MTTKEIKKLMDRIENVQRVTKKLGEQSAAFADFVCNTMQTAGVNKLSVDGHTIRWRERRTSAGYYDTLKLDDRDGDLLLKEIGYNKGLYVHGDFGHWEYYPDRETVLAFLSLVPGILKALAELSEVPEKVQKSLALAEAVIEEA